MSLLIIHPNSRNSDDESAQSQQHLDDDSDDDAAESIPDDDEASAAAASVEETIQLDSNPRSTLSGLQFSALTGAATITPMESPNPLYREADEGHQSRSIAGDGARFDDESSVNPLHLRGSGTQDEEENMEFIL